MTSTILASVNLICALLAYSLLAYAIMRLRWHDRGISLVLMLIIICGQIWLIPQAISTFGFGADTTLYSLWFANWIVSAFTNVLLWQSLREVPRDLEDAARLDGCGPFGVYWHVVLPLVRPHLLLIAILLVIASAILLAAPPLLKVTTPFLIGGSLAMTLPLMGIFFLARHYFPNRT